MTCEGELRGIGSVEAQSCKGDEHVGLFDAWKNGVDAIEQSGHGKTLEQALAHGTLDHAHQYAGWNAVARDVGKISEDSLLRIGNEVYQIAANFRAGNGSSVSFQCRSAVRESRDQSFLKTVREGQLGFELDVGDTLGVGEN
jgi:hypothetical protein